MNLIPWKNKSGNGSGSTAPLAELRSEMDRVFDTFMRDPWSALSDRFNGQRFLFPMLDIAENDNEVTVRAEVPGVDPKDLQITVTGNRLELAGEKQESKERKGEAYDAGELKRQRGEARH